MLDTSSKSGLVAGRKDGEHDARLTDNAISVKGTDCITLGPIMYTALYAKTEDLFTPTTCVSGGKRSVPLDITNFKKY